jgi:hypothetical protein
MVVNEGPIGGGEATDAEPRIEPVSSGPRGIGGWLILPAIGIVLSPLLSLAGIAESVDILGQLPSGTLIHGLVWVEVIANAAMVAFAVKVAFDFFRLKRQAPANYIAFLVTTVVLHAADLFVALQFLGMEFLPEDARTLTRAIIAGAVWIPYFVRSKRVANTFVR